jgi:hypothetical protein
MNSQEAKELFQQLNEYYVTKLLNHEYEVVSVHDHVIAVSMPEDGAHFSLWTSNAPVNLSCYRNSLGLESLIWLQFTEEQQNILHPQLNADAQKYRQRPDVAEARYHQYLRLKSEFEPTE